MGLRKGDLLGVYGYILLFTWVISLYGICSPKTPIGLLKIQCLPFVNDLIYLLPYKSIPGIIGPHRDRMNEATDLH